MQANGAEIDSSREESGTGMKTSEDGSEAADEEGSLAMEILQGMSQFTMKDFMNLYVEKLLSHNAEYLELTDF